MNNRENWKWGSVTGEAGVTQNYTRPRKLNCRHSTIIDFYRTVSGNKTIPKDKQYWTMCNKCVDGGEVFPKSELDQIIKSELITLNQFYGVDNNEEVINNNRTLKYDVGDWIHNDFYLAMTEADYNGTFNPAIINFDTTSMTKTNLKNIGKLLWFLQETGYSDVLIVCNNILRILYQGTKPEDFDVNVNVIEGLSNTTLGEIVLNDPNLMVSPECYTYRGGGGAKNIKSTIMGTVCFWRK